MKINKNENLSKFLAEVINGLQTTDIIRLKGVDVVINISCEYKRPKYVKKRNNLDYLGIYL